MKRARFPVWVNLDGLAMSALRLFYPREPTFIVRFGTSQMCHSAERQKLRKFISEFPKFRFSPDPNQFISLPSRPTEGRIAIVTDAERDAMDAAVPGARDDGRAGLPVSRQQRADERRFFAFAKASARQTSIPMA